MLGAATALPSGALAQKKPVAAAKVPARDIYTVNAGFIAATPLPPREIHIPDVEGFKVLKGDFHIHTLFSDGDVMPGDRVTEALLNGLDIIAITDHIEYRPYFSHKGKWLLNEKDANNFNLWYEIAAPEAEKKGLLLVRAAEITKSFMPPGHFNALFTTDNNPIAAAVDDWEKMLEAAAAQGAFLLWNHPGWEAPTSGGIEKGAPLRFTPAHQDAHRRGLLHGVEVFNDTEFYPAAADWCNQYNLAFFANSDIHPSEFNRYGIHNPLRPITLVLAREKTVESAKEAFFARRSIAWAANTLWGPDKWLTSLFNASVEVKALSPGVLELVNKSSLPVTITLEGATIELPRNVKRQVLRAGGATKLGVANWMTGSDKTLEIQLSV
ncbi:histidinol-phosphatase [Bacteroidia bacterium]|nr:histidinol-phosphatase [Bacteroidia bacterium]